MRISNKQKLALELLDRPHLNELLLGGSAGGSKSWIMCMMMVTLCRKYPGARLFLGRKTLQSLKKSTISTLVSKVHPFMGVGDDEFALRTQEAELIYKNGSKIYFGELDRQPADPDFARIGSLEIDCAFIDEAGEITLEAKNAIKSRVGRGVMATEYDIPGKVILSCIPEGKLVQTDSGYKEVENVSEDDRLLSENGSLVEIKRIFKREADEKIYKIKCSNIGEPLVLTSEHPVLVSTAKRRKETGYINGKQWQKYHLDHNFEYRPVKSVSVGDWLQQPIVRDKTPVPYEWRTNSRMKMECPFGNPEFWWMVGFWLGDGWVSKTSIQFAVGDDHPEIMDRLCKVIRSLGRKPLIQENKSGRSASVQFTSKQLADFLNSSFGAKASGKYIPYWAQNMEHNLALVDGYLDSDGCLTKNNSCCEFVSINYKLLCGIQQILFKYGVIGSIEKRNIRGFVKLLGRTVYQQDRYHLSLGREASLAYKPLSGSCKARALKVNLRKGRTRRDCYIDGDRVYFKVKSVGVSDYNGNVYNFETSSHNYVAEDFTVHNCNPAQNFLRQEYYDPYTQLGGGSYQEWEIGKVRVGDKDLPSFRGFLRISAYDNPFLPKSYIDTLRSLPDRERKRLLDGNWNYADDDDTLFSLSLLDRATCFTPPVQGEKFNKFIGVDVSDKGTDATIFTLIDNGVVVSQHKSKVQMSWDAKSELPISRLIADELISFAQKNGFTSQFARHIAVECNGIGVGCRDMLKERGWHITEYVATHKSRSQNYYQMMLDFDSGELKIMHDLLGLDELRKQLTAHTYEMNNQEPSVLKKEKIKQVLGHSPDEADSLMIANYCRNWISNPQNDPKRNQNRILI